MGWEGMGYTAGTGVGDEFAQTGLKESPHSARLSAGEVQSLFGQCSNTPK